ncbi:MAG: hypothetical protein AAF333_18125 [Planctomycetota bacterium]
MSWDSTSDADRDTNTASSYSLPGNVLYYDPDVWPEPPSGPLGLGTWPGLSSPRAFNSTVRRDATAQLVFPDDQLAARGISISGHTTEIDDAGYRVTGRFGVGGVAVPQGDFSGFTGAHINTSARYSVSEARAFEVDLSFERLGTAMGFGFQIIEETTGIVALAVSSVWQPGESPGESIDLALSGVLAPGDYRIETYSREDKGFFGGPESVAFAEYDVAVTFGAAASPLDDVEQFYTAADAPEGLRVTSGHLAIPEWASHLTEPEPTLIGDYDANGVVGQADLDLALLSWGKGGYYGSLPAAWVARDQFAAVNEEEGVGQDELDRVLRYWGNHDVAVTTIPEPASAWGLLVGVWGLTRRLGREERA